ncbi:adhesive plaque matrix protein-like [Histomonas meleagridis]|uniref:adhesive plaque matrix protein-like n=1 Tax=Histomonas meleagridis TaxID=135588 RepID=UPI00355AC940|nr:adhesive plaque matrix protein-like [Histomonas meleagridis]KAH0804214.1 adhesive plaque matrix protein-like [Histomonas meleagridis]
MRVSQRFSSYPIKPKKTSTDLSWVPPQILFQLENNVFNFYIIRTTLKLLPQVEHPEIQPFRGAPEWWNVEVDKQLCVTLAQEGLLSLWGFAEQINKDILHLNLSTEQFSRNRKFDFYLIDPYFDDKLNPLRFLFSCKTRMARVLNFCKQIIFNVKEKDFENYPAENDKRIVPQEEPGKIISQYIDKRKEQARQDIIAICNSFSPFPNKAKPEVAYESWPRSDSDDVIEIPKPTQSMSQPPTPTKRPTPAPTNQPQTPTKPPYAPIPTPVTTPSPQLRPAHAPSALTRPSPTPNASPTPVHVPNAPPRPVPTPTSPSKPVPASHAPPRPAPVINAPSAPSRPASTPNVQAQPAPAANAPSKPVTASSAASKPVTASSAASKPVTTSNAPSKPVTTSNAPSKPVTASNAPSKPVTTSNAPSKPVTASNAPSTPSQQQPAHKSTPNQAAPRPSQPPAPIPQVTQQPLPPSQNDQSQDLVPVIIDGKEFRRFKKGTKKTTIITSSKKAVQIQLTIGGTPENPLFTIRSMGEPGITLENRKLDEAYSMYSKMLELFHASDPDCPVICTNYFPSPVQFFRLDLDE